MKKMRFSPALLSIAFCALLFSCKKPDPQQCHAFDKNMAGWHIPSQGDSMVFANSNGNKVFFYINDQINTSAYEEKPKKGELGGYYVQPCNILSYSAADSNKFNMTVLQSPGTDVINHFNYRMLNVSVGMSVTGNGTFIPPSSPSEDNTYYEQFTLGNKTYNGVIRMNPDTLHDSTLYYSSLYTAREAGLVGFYDRRQKAFYYRLK